MPKPESWRLDAASYPVCAEFQTRFQDMDINGHLNNVAFAALFESGRVLLNREPLKPAAPPSPCRPSWRCPPSPAPPN